MELNSSFCDLMASSDSSCDRQWKYDVFLSFRGIDTGKTFTDHLYTALEENRFYAFKDLEKHEKGEEIAPEFLTAIEESKISITVFSKNYASSRWCLAELVTIIDHMKEPGRMVIPVFYHVDPSEVRNQTGTYGEAFLSHERDAGEEKKETVKRWRAALREASNLVGWHLEDQYESEVLDEIITDVLRRLNCELLQVDYDTVGMESRLKELMPKINLRLDKVLMVGIYGAGGIGKTTIAKVIYNKISYHFQRTIFARGHELNGPQFQQLLDDESSMETHGRTKNKQILLVVDDVDQSSQVQYLVEFHKLFIPRSRIIFTTSDKDLLNVPEVDEPHELIELTHEEATQLFSWHAFKQTFPKKDYMNLVKDVVRYVKAHPLVLKALGSFLFGKTETEWKCILPDQNKNTYEAFYNALKVKFDGLSLTEQAIFLDAALFKAKFDASISTSGIQVLQDKRLATISNSKLHMHDLLQQMAQKLIHENNPQEPGQRKGLQDPRHVYPRLRTNMGTKGIQKIQFSSADFQVMLKLYYLIPFQLKSLPPNFPGDSLSLLNSSYSDIRPLWEGNKNLGNLIVLNLSSFRNLVKIPNISSVPTLERLNFPGCAMLSIYPVITEKMETLEDPHMGLLEIVCLCDCSKPQTLSEITVKMKNLTQLHLVETAIKELPSSIENLTALKVLDLKLCESLANLPSSISELKRLKILRLSGCSNLQSFPEITREMEYLEWLCLDGTAIKELPSSFVNLTALKVLDLKLCESLANLPSSISELKRLKILRLSGCSNLQSFPEITREMEYLEWLCLDGTAIKELPSSFVNLTALKVLDLKLCESLANLPSSISELKRLKILRLSGCSNLQSFPEITREMEYLEWLCLDGTAIKELPSSIVNLTALKVLDLKLCESLANLPSSISDLEHLKSLRLSGCSNLQSFPEIGCSNLQSFPEIRCSYLWNFPENYRAFRKLARR